MPRLTLRSLGAFFLAAFWMAACTPEIARRPTAVPTLFVTDTQAPRAATSSAIALTEGTPPVSEEVVERTPSPTSAPSPIAPYPDGCIDARQVTLKQAGQTICVGGLVFLATLTHGDMYVAFSSDQSAFYMLGYDWGSAKGFNAGDCVYANGLIESLGSVPIMSVDRYTLHACAPKPYLTPTPPVNLPVGCRFALDLTLSDFGKPFCVGGIVAFVNPTDDVREVYFSLVLSIGLHFVVRNVTDKDPAIHPGDCIFVTDHKVDKLGRSIVISVGPADIKRCPEVPSS
jgi:hypothetical protein